ncbi:perilipin-3-like [Indicator indicator]|uniref:perilipin-3-like n=1 Tax=Indicator indicator TaxID=1002788 RepID=UPI0023DF827B|nr:perilipin-3-like [Indicator indicator]
MARGHRGGDTRAGRWLEPDPAVRSPRDTIGPHVAAPPRPRPAGVASKDRYHDRGSGQTSIPRRKYGPRDITVVGGWRLEGGPERWSSGPASGAFGWAGAGQRTQGYTPSDPKVPVPTPGRPKGTAQELQGVLLHAKHLLTSLPQSPPRTRPRGCAGPGQESSDAAAGLASPWDPSPYDPSLPSAATATMSAKTTMSTEDDQEMKSVVSRVANLTLVSSACGAISTAYASTKDRHPYLKSVCNAAEKGVRTLTAAAVSGAQPLLIKLEPQISTANEYACKGLDKLEEKLPILQQPPEKVVAGTRELVSCTVSGAVGLARGAVWGGVERTRLALSTGVGTVVGSRVGQLLATGVDAVLGKSEELVERYLPGTEEEPAGVADVEVTMPERPKRWQSCFVRVGSLSAKLRHRALRGGGPPTGGSGACGSYWNMVGGPTPRQGSEGWGGRVHANERHQGMESGAMPMEETKVEPRTLAMLRGLLHQLHAACARLVSSARALPSSVQETAGQVQHVVEDVQASLSRVHTFHDLSDLVLAQSHETMQKAQTNIDELLEYVGQHAPVPWLAGPFAPALVEYPEDVPVEMSKWEGCVTVEGTHHATAAPRCCS